MLPLRPPLLARPLAPASRQSWSFVGRARPLGPAGLLRIGLGAVLACLLLQATDAQASRGECLAALGVLERSLVSEVSAPGLRTWIRGKSGWVRMGADGPVAAAAGAGDLFSCTAFGVEPSEISLALAAANGSLRNPARRLAECYAAFVASGPVLESLGRARAVALGGIVGERLGIAGPALGVLWETKVSLAAMEAEGTRLFLVASGMPETSRREVLSSYRRECEALGVPLAAVVAAAQRP